jgi:hypothetical protein
VHPVSSTGSSVGIGPRRVGHHTQRSWLIAQSASVCPTACRLGREVSCVGQRQAVALRPTVLSRKAASLLWLPSPRFGERGWGRGVLNE